MRNNLYKSFKVITLITIAFLFACEREEIVEFSFDESTDRLFVEKLDNVDLFYDAAQKAGLETRFSGSSDFTYFVPNNDAMLVALNAGGFSNINEASTEFLTQLVNNHTVSGLILADSITKSAVMAESGEIIYTSGGDNGVYLNARSQVISADNRSINGVVHIINYPIIVFPSQTIAGIVSVSAGAVEPEFTTLLAALNYAGLTSTLQNDDASFTVFAPTDAAFAAIGLDAVSVLALPQEDVVELLSFHVIDGRFFSVDLGSGRVFTIAGDADEGIRGIDLEVSNSEVVVDGQAEATASGANLNLLATNGTVHIVDNVVFPRPYVVDAINGSFGLSGFDGTLLGAFSAAIQASSLDVDALLRTEDTVSMLAPRFFDASAGNLEERIQNHLFEGLLDVSTFEGGQIITSINGARYYVTQGFNGNTYINGRSGIQTFTSGATIIEDYSSYNGLITNFVRELTPLPEDSTASEVLVANYDGRNLFAALLEFLELDNLPDHTYLAPSDAALAAVVDELDITTNADGEFILEDVEALTEIINAHIVSEIFFDIDFDAGDSYTDLNGDEVNIVSIPIPNTTDRLFGIQLNDDGNISVITINASDDGGGDVLYNQGVVHSVSDILVAL